MLTFDPCKHQANSPESNYGIGKHEHLLYSSTTNCLRLVLSGGCDPVCGCCWLLQFSRRQCSRNAAEIPDEFPNQLTLRRSVRFRSRCCLYLAQYVVVNFTKRMEEEVSWQLRPSSTKSDPSQVAPHFHEVCIV